MPVVRLVKRHRIFSIRVVLFLKHASHTLPYSKIGLTMRDTFNDVTGHPRRLLKASCKPFSTFLRFLRL